MFRREQRGRGDGSPDRYRRDHANDRHDRHPARNDAEKRSHHLDGIEAVAEAYSSFAPEGRIVLWEEAPVGGRWIESGAWNGRSVSKLERLGPEIFAAQKRRVTDVAPGVDVGIFVHFPYLVDGKQPATFRTLVEELRSRNALPDFTFADFYRGWYAKDAGPGPASAAIRSLVTNAREATGGRPVTYLGQAHTINPQYTPSRQAMWMDLRAALEAGAEAVGWYARKPYKETKQGFDPLLPNAGPAARDGSAANTLTFARDRYQYAYAALRAKRDANCGPGKRATSGDRFDLWLAGRDFDFYDHRLSLRTRGGEWAFVGDFNGYLDGEYPYGDGSAHVSIFRGLSRSRFAPEGDLELAIDTDPESDGARLDGILAMPEDVSTYRTEPEATELYAERSDIHEFSLGHERTDARLTANDSRQFGVELCDPERPLDELVFPGHRAQREQLRAFESRDGFDPGELFDLWLLTDERTEREAGSAIERLSLAGDAKRRPLDEASTAVSTADGGAIYYGIDRGSLARRDGSAAVELAGDGREAVASAYAMPYAGTVAFRPAAEAVELVRDDRASARTFAIAHEEK